jgi:hypothetical protein
MVVAVLVQAGFREKNTDSHLKQRSIKRIIKLAYKIIIEVRDNK